MVSSTATSSPGNTLVDSEGLIKVADFGIARVAGSSTLSKGDNVMGSVHYFSPEQARGEDVTFASDTTAWAWCCMKC